LVVIKIQRLIGDYLSDVEFGKAFGEHGVYVLIGHGLHDYHLGS